MASSDYSEAMVNIFFTIVKKTPSGGATMEELQEAYSEVKGNIPSERTIQRTIRRLRELFDPLAFEEPPDDFAEEPAPEEELCDDDYTESEIGIKKVHRDRKSYYIFEGNLNTPTVDVNQALFSVLSLYPQNRNMLKDAYKNAMQKLLGDAMKGITSYIKLISEIDTHVYVAEPVPADVQKHARLIEEIFRALREKKCVRIKYVRTSDGSKTERIVEPYGLICRFNNWYLTGYCKNRKERRVFHLVHIQDLKVLDTSRYNMPQGFLLSEEYSRMWAIRTGENPGKAEKVRLLVSKGVAERFAALKFHNTQRVKKLKDGEVEVTYHLKWADEIIPWLVGWGTTIKVLEPEWLRQQTIETLQNTLKHHNK